MLADKAYDADRMRELIQDQGATPNIPPKSNRRWKPCFSKRLYRERKAEALPPRRYPLRQARRQLPRNDPTRLDAAVAPELMSLRPNSRRAHKMMHGNRGRLP